MENRSKAAHSFLLKQSKANQHIALNKLLKSIDTTSLNRKDNKQAFYLFLIKTIVSQQVSTSAAKTIWNKLENIAACPIWELKSKKTETTLRVTTTENLLIACKSHYLDDIKLMIYYSHY